GCFHKWSKTVRADACDAAAGTGTVQPGAAYAGLRSLCRKRAGEGQYSDATRRAVDGTTTGQTTPARVQVPAGLHTVTVKLTGYQPVRRTIQASEGGTVDITNVTMQPK